MLLKYSNLSKKKKNSWIVKAEMPLEDNPTTDENEVSYDDGGTWWPITPPVPRAPGPSMMDLSTENLGRSPPEGLESIIEVEELASISRGVDTDGFNQMNICSEEGGSSGLNKQGQSSKKWRMARMISCFRPRG